MKNSLTKKKFAVYASLLLAGVIFAASPAEAFWFWNFSKKEDKPAPQAASSVIPAPSPGKLTLIDAYRLALKKSETVALSAEEIDQARARFYRSFDYFLPQVSFVMSEMYQDASGSTGSVSSNAGRRSTPENKFTFTQPLFSGFREIAALQGAGADKKQQVLTWKRAKETLFVDVMDAYFELLQAERNVNTLMKTHRLGADRLRELDNKIKVGRLRPTDKQSSLADLKLVESDLINAQSVLTVARNLLEFYIGRPLGDTQLSDEEIPTQILEAPDVSAKAGARSDVAAAEQGYIVAEKKVIGAQADLFPTISASGNYYTRRVGFQSGNDWDVTVEMDVPIFEVGKTLGDIKEAVTTRETERLKWSQARRMADLDIRDALVDLRSMRANERALWSARDAASKNYNLVSSDYSRSLISNLDVLDALRRLQDVELRYNEAYFSMKESYWKFKAALGEIITMPGFEENGKHS